MAVAAYIQRLTDILSHGGQLTLVQIYTRGRMPIESYVTAPAATELAAIVNRVRAKLAGVPVECYPWRGGYQGQSKKEKGMVGAPCGVLNSQRWPQTAARLFKHFQLVSFKAELADGFLHRNGVTARPARGAIMVWRLA